MPVSAYLIFTRQVMREGTIVVNLRPLHPALKENFKRLFFASFQPSIIINIISEKAAPPVAPHITQRGLRPSTADKKPTYKLVESSRALARQNPRSVGVCLELLVLQSLSKDGSSQKNIKEKTSGVVSKGPNPCLRARILFIILWGENKPHRNAPLEHFVFLNLN